MIDDLPMTERIVVYSKYTVQDCAKEDCSLGKTTELQLIHAGPCSSAAQCAEATDVIFSVTVDGKEIFRIPGSALNKETLTRIWKTFLPSLR